jgi:K+-transporting ATPase ATPase A chain
MDVLLIIATALLLSWPLGCYLYGVYAPGEGGALYRRHWSDRLFLPLERVLLRLAGVSSHSMHWQQYGLAFLAANLLLGLLAYALLMLQHVLPLNPDGIAPLSWDLALHTTVSFLTNTNQQHYSGQAQLTLFSQSVVLVTLQFVTPAMGLALGVAVLRAMKGGLNAATAQPGEPRQLGNFYQDTLRALTRVLLPLSLLLALLLGSQGVPSNYAPATVLPLLEQPDATQPLEQKIPQGPVAAMVAIKQLGTNGGGWYGPNSSNPLENPTPLSNALQTIALVLIPMAMVWLMGFMLKERGFARMSFAVMLVLSVSFIGVTLWSEQQPNAAFAGLAAVDGNMEGKEVRFGTDLSALWASFTTQTSNGSVNAMHDSLNPWAGLMTRAAMLINAIWGGIGCGLINFIVYVWLAVFIAGLMIGRTPEMFGRKLEKTELSWLGVLLVLPSLVILGFTAITLSVPGLAGNSNPGLHGISQVFYEYTSAFANNGSGFEGLADNTVWWNLSTVVTLLLGRYLPLLIPLLVAGRLAAKRPVADSAASLPLNSLVFGVTLITVILLLNFLSFLPSMVLGPIGEALAGQ